MKTKLILIIVLAMMAPLLAKEDDFWQRQRKFSEKLEQESARFRQRMEAEDRHREAMEQQERIHREQMEQREQIHKDSLEQQERIRIEIERCRFYHNERPWALR